MPSFCVRGSIIFNSTLFHYAECCDDAEASRYLEISDFPVNKLPPSIMVRRWERAGGYADQVVPSSQPREAENQRAAQIVPLGCRDIGISEAMSSPNIRPPGAQTVIVNSISGNPYVYPSSSTLVIARPKGPGSILSQGVTFHKSPKTSPTVTINS